MQMCKEESTVAGEFFGLNSIHPSDFKHERLTRIEKLEELQKAFLELSSSPLKNTERVDTSLFEEDHYLGKACRPS